MERRDLISIIALLISLLSLYISVRREARTRHLEMVQKKGGILMELYRSESMAMEALAYLPSMANLLDPHKDRDLQNRFEVSYRKASVSLESLRQQTKVVEELDPKLIATNHDVHVLLEEFAGRAKISAEMAADILRDVKDMYEGAKRAATLRASAGEKS